ncbi:hypothetical protein PIB30_000586 [Stylosanthes scabra]|uniref:Uncharacterized protein n=1 Tax=Stylosanthes scabra TaxID=79078 RepID=A0ABU6X3F2_9FABA|nr:hypothetical protein [Stylosanthes scabra]
MSFMNCEDEGLLAKLAGEKTPKKVIDGGAGNKRRIDRKEPCSDSVEISDGDIPLAALMKTRTPKKIKATTPVKKGTLSKSVSNLGGRNLSTKLLRLGSKPKSR